MLVVFFFQAEDGIRDLVRSRGLGDVYKRQALIAAGIKRVVVFTDFHDTLATQFYSDAEVEVVKMDMPSKEIQYDLMNYSSAKKTEKSK